MKQPLKQILVWCLTILLSTLTLPSSPVLADDLSSPNPCFQSPKMIFDTISQKQLDAFCRSVAIQGDSVVIGAPLGDNTAADSGEVFLYHPSTGSMERLSLPNTLVAYDYFGQSVAQDGDYILVGANGQKYGTANDAGIAYLFNLDGELKRTFHSPEPIASNFFGYSVALDVDHNRVLIGAYGKDIGRTDSGSAYLFDLDGNEIKTFRNPNPIANNERFGWSVAVNGNNVLIGAENKQGTGVAYLFDVNDDAPIHTLYIPIFVSTGALFGHSVSIDGDVALVGAPVQSIGGVNKTGAVFQFDVETGELTRIYLDTSPSTDEYFGGSVKVVGNAVLIGAQGKKNENGVLAGAAFLYNASGNDGGIHDYDSPEPLVSFLNPMPTLAAEKFGSTVALDTNGGIVIGAEEKCINLKSYCYDVRYYNGYRFGAAFLYKDYTGALAELTQSSTNSSVVVNIDSVDNVSSQPDFTSAEGTSPVTVKLQPGTYTISVIDESEGGGYNAWSRNNGKISGCNNDGDDCAKGWEHGYAFEYGLETKVVAGTGCHDSVKRAVEQKPVNKSFTLDDATDVEFYVVDSGNPTNNLGGVSLRIVKE